MKTLIVFLSLFYPLSSVSAQADSHIIRTAPDPDALKRDIHEVRPMRKDYYVFRTNRHLPYFRTDENIYLTIAFWADTQKRYLVKEIPSEVYLTYIQRVAMLSEKRREVAILGLDVLRVARW